MNVTIDRLIAAVNAHDLDALSVLFHPDYESRQPAHPGARVRGALPGARELGGDVRRGSSTSTRNSLACVQDGDTTWCEWTWSGTRSDDQPFEMRGVTLFRISGGVIVAGSLYMEAGRGRTGRHRAGGRGPLGTPPGTSTPRRGVENAMSGCLVRGIRSSGVSPGSWALSPGGP